MRFTNPNVGDGITSLRRLPVDPLPLTFSASENLSPAAKPAIRRHRCLSLPTRRNPSRRVHDVDMERRQRVAVCTSIKAASPVTAAARCVLQPRRPIRWRAVTHGQNLTRSRRPWWCWSRSLHPAPIPAPAALRRPPPASCSCVAHLRRRYRGGGRRPLNLRGDPARLPVWWRRCQQDALRVLAGPRAADGYRWWQVSRLDQPAVSGWGIANKIQVVKGQASLPAEPRGHVWLNKTEYFTLLDKYKADLSELEKEHRHTGVG